MPSSEEEGLGEEVEPPFRVREDGWVFEKVFMEGFFSKNTFSKAKLLITK